MSDHARRRSAARLLPVVSVLSALYPRPSRIQVVMAGVPLAILLNMGMVNFAFADGGAGGSIFGGTGGAGGADSATGAGGTGGTNTFLTNVAGGGGGAGATGGDGGTGNGGATAGGLGGATAGAAGAVGADAPGGSFGGGGGGGGGAHGVVHSATATDAGSTGGAGGAGGNGGSIQGAGAGGGGGGWGVSASGAGVVYAMTGTAQGGAGGAGGNSAAGPAPNGGSGGNGGAGAGVSGGATLVNTGTITGGNGGLAGIGTNRNGDHGAGGAGVTASGGAIVTSGAISGGLSGDGVTRGNAINVTGGTNTLTLQAGATLTGNINIQAGSLSFSQATDQTVNNTITGTGAVIQSGGGGKLTLGGANSYAGGTSINGGTLAVSADNNLGNGTGGLAFDGGTLQLDAGFNLAGTRAIVLNAGGGTMDTASFNTTVSQGISGAGGLTKTGSGTLTLTGTNSFNGATSIDAGTLVVNGSMTSAVTVNSGTTLGGSGTIGDTNILSGGVFAPGNSIGTISVNGNVTFAAGSIYRVEVDSAGSADRINASGTATLNGGTVDVQASGGTYQRNTSYTILNATGGVTGTFASVTSNLAFLTPSLAYDANNVTLTMARNDVQLSGVAVTVNQTVVAQYLDSLGNNPAITGLFAQLDGLTAEQARNAFASLGGDTLSAGAAVAMSGSRSFMNLLSGRLGNSGAGSRLAFTGMRLASGLAPLSDAPAVYAQAGGSGASAFSTGRGFWMQGSGARGGMDGNGNATGFDWRGTSLAAGADTEVSPGVVLGAAVSYGHSNISPDTGGSGRVKSPRVALYGSQDAGPWIFRGSAGYAAQDFETQRFVTIGNSTGVASSSHRGDEWSFSAEAEYSIHKGGYQLRPLVGLRYINLKEDGYTETGSNAPLTIVGRSTESIASLLGARYVRPINKGAGNFEARAVWSHDFGDTDPAVSGRFAAVPAGAAFTVSGVPVKRDALTLGAGFSNQAAKNLSVYADFNVELRGNGQTQYVAMGGVRYSF